MSVRRVSGVRLAGPCLPGLRLRKKVLAAHALTCSLARGATARAVPAPMVWCPGTCDVCGVCGLSGEGAAGCLGCDGATPFAEYDCRGQCDGLGTGGLWDYDIVGACCEVRWLGAPTPAGHISHRGDAR